VVRRCLETRARPPRAQPPLRFPLILAGLAWICTGALACSGEPESTPKGVILISIDTLRADHLGAYGYAHPTSPALDAIARDGVVFESAVSTSPWTAPAHASMLTGQYPNRHGLVTYRNKLDPRSPHLAERLRDAGYQTAAIVSASNVGSDYGFDRGFESFVQLPELHPVESSGVTEAAIAWLGKRDETRPFFLFLHLFDLHNPYGAKPEYEAALVEPYDGDFSGDTLQLLEVFQGRREMNERDLAHVVQLYDAGIRQVDDEIARLRSALEARGLFDRTLVIVTSDHGEEFRDHGGFLHAYSHYQELLHVPLFLRGPGLPRGARIAEPVSLVDLMPTVLAYLGIEPAREQSGVDLRALWGADDAPPLPDRTLFSEADQTNRKPNIRRSARRGSHKLLYNLRTRKIELYDLANDPAEQHDLAEEEPAIRRQLLTDLNEFIQGAEARGELREVTDQQLEELRRLGYIQDAPEEEQKEGSASE